MQDGSLNFECLAQGHFDLWRGGAGDWTTCDWRTTYPVYFLSHSFPCQANLYLVNSPYVACLSLSNTLLSSSIIIPPFSQPYTHPFILLFLLHLGLCIPLPLASFVLPATFTSFNLNHQVTYDFANKQITSHFTWKGQDAGSLCCIPLVKGQRMRRR